MPGVDIWYFAFGSNMSTRRMKKAIGQWNDARRAILRGYEAGFFSYSQQWGCGVLDLVEREGANVPGVAYLIDEERANVLDRYEGVPSIARRLHVRVEVEGLGEVDAYTYVMVDRRKFVQPSNAYLDSLVSGLREWGYGERVEEILRKARTPGS
ncbi:MAG: gamma-glutamylcyclotransferase family protein [Conexivisphaera sp.]